MQILWLGPERPQIFAYLQSMNHEILRFEEPLHADMAFLDHIDFIISYGYRHIIKRDMIERFPGKIINLHISLLPWNKGADPNLWSFLENTPKGVSIHFVDAGLDTGDIIAQQEINFSDRETLRTSYATLSMAIEDLFKRVWPAVETGQFIAIPQPSGGTYHRLKDKERYMYLLVDGWDTSVSLLNCKALTVKEKRKEG